MSARKSWDIQPKRAAAPAPTPPRMTRRVEMVRSSSPRQAPARPVRRVSAPKPKERPQRASPLRERRKKEKKRVWVLLLVLFLALLGIVLYVLWLPALRVSAIEAEGADTDGIARVSMEALQGTAFFVLPKSSIFLIPEADIRARVLEAYPSVQAVSISATGLTTLKVRALARGSAFVWCGESPALPALTCYEADAEGLVFAEHVMASTTATSSELLVYGALEGADASPIRAHVTYASALPDALSFIKAMRGLGADIASVTLRGDEVDLHTRGGTRITYVIGKEGEAAILAATSFPDLQLNDGSLEYVDLRFQNKVYLKRRGEAAE